jgi:hypothetical protein
MWIGPHPALYPLAMRYYRVGAQYSTGPMAAYAVESEPKCISEKAITVVYALGISRGRGNPDMSSPVARKEK